MAKMSIRIEKFQEGKFFGYQVVPSIQATEVKNDENVIISNITRDFVKENGEGEVRYFDFHEAVEAKETLTKRFQEAGFEVIDEGLVSY